MTAEERIAELERVIADLRRQLEESRRENAALREENARLRRELEEWKRGHRERRKRRSSRAEGAQPKTKKKPGRKAGHPGAFRPVPKPDREVEHPMPSVCTCGGDVAETEETEETVIQDIPEPQALKNTRHFTRVGACIRCGQRVCAKLPGTPPSGRSVAEVQLGPNVQGLILDLRFERYVSLRGICGFLKTWYGLTITPGGVSQIITREAERTAYAYEEARAELRRSKIVGLDETGIRQDGLSGWAWLGRTDRVSVFQIELSRGAWVAEAILGSGFQGVVCTDFYGVYTARDDWTHQYCSAHVIREVRKIAEVDPNGLTESFRDEIVKWYVEGRKAQACGTREEREKLKYSLAELVTERPSWEHPEVQRIADRLAKHFDGVVLFLDHRKVPADNNGTERDIRALARYRKVTGGTRSARGSAALAHWMTVSQTLRKNGGQLGSFVIANHAARLDGIPPPSLFQPP